jgi:hypothetical protein
MTAAAEDEQDVEKSEACALSRNVTWWSHFREQSGSSLKIKHRQAQWHTPAVLASQEGPEFKASLSNLAKLVSKF